MVDTFYKRFIFFADSDMLVCFKLGEQVFDDLAVYLVVGLGIPYVQSVLDEIHEIRIESRRRHGDNVGG